MNQLKANQKKFIAADTEAFCLTSTRDSRRILKENEIHKFNDDSITVSLKEEL
jgi:hypothetical protein